jgi:hypothetical protein
MSQFLGRALGSCKRVRRPWPAHAISSGPPNTVMIPEAWRVLDAEYTQTRPDHTQDTTEHPWQDMTRALPFPSPTLPPTCQLAAGSRLHLHLMSRRGGTTSSWSSSNGTARLESRIPERRGSRSRSRQYRYDRRKNLSSTPTRPGGARLPGFLGLPGRRKRVVAVIL